MVAEEARALASARHAWAARVDLATIVSVRSTSDEIDGADALAVAGAPAPPAPPPLATLLLAARPVARADGFLAVAMPGSNGTPEGLLAITRTPTDDDAVLELALGQLATVAGLSLEAARLRTRVEGVTKAREVLLASVSHDLRNPLNTFAMSAGLLRDDVERNDVDTTRGISLISRMERATSRMQGLIEDLVEASRIDARKIDLVIREENAAQLIKDAVAAAKPAPPERGAAVTSEETDEAALVLADRARTLQALAKVIAFVTKATGDSGAIRLGVTRQGEAVGVTARAFGPGGAPVPPPEEGRGGLALLIAHKLIKTQRKTFHIEGGEELVVAFTLPAKA
jgi:signal transduction histidine kinase